MSSLDQRMNDLRELFDEERRASQELRRTRKGVDRGAPAEIEERAQNNLDSVRVSIKRKLQDLLDRPPHFIRHLNQLPTFYQNDKPEKCVFIMTKFPEGDAPLDQQLQQVIDTIMENVKACGYTPRVAKRITYHDWLWDNVELYLLACSRGIAIVEDKYRPELNPNVAMEWGWMRAMGKPVLFLAEQSFAHGRADWEGLIKHRFDWLDPARGTKEAIESWLPK